MILPPAPKTEGKTTKFSGFVRMCGLADAGDPALYERPAASAPAPGVDVAASPPPVRAARRHVARRMPSRSFHSGMKAGALFASERGRVAALRRGTEAHEALAQVAWWDAAAARTDLERALVRPTGPVELWRETPYELCRDGVWESGQFDRVVFTGTGADRRATIYDFKTNVPRPEETEAAAVLARELPHVRVRGLMTIPPVETVPHGNLVYFEKMHRLYVDINGKIYDNELEYISMGMSGDFADAIRAGSNMVRVGTAIFGARDYTK